MPVISEDPYRPTRPDREARVRKLRAVIPQLAKGGSVLDVGAGEQPYRELFESAGLTYVPLDLGAPAAVIGRSERLPFASDSFDAAVSFQVLEHVDSPAATAEELCRVLRPGGRAIVTTHGNYPYHPHPHDLWRWTGEGLEKLFTDAGFDTTVSGLSGSMTTLTMLVGYYIKRLAKRYPKAGPAQRLIPLLNRLGAAADRRVPELSDPRRSGSMFMNFFVVATKPDGAVAG